MWKYILSFTGGIGVGAAGCYFILNKKYEDKLNNELEDRLNKELEPLNKLYEELAIKHTEDQRKEYASSSEDDRTEPKVVRTNKRIPATESKRRNYAGMYGNDPAESESPTEDDDEIFGEQVAEAHERDRYKGPRVIPDEEYGEYMAYNQTTLLYYPEQRILVDETNPDEEIYDIESIAGDKLDMIDEKYMATKDYINIRNFSHSTDYKIFFVDGFYNAPGR